MADFEKVWQIKLNTGNAHRKLLQLERSAKRLDKVFNRDFGANADLVLKRVSATMEQLNKTFRFTEKHIKATNKQVGKLGAEIDKSKIKTIQFDRQIRKIGKSFEAIGNKLSLYVTAPLAALGVVSFRAARDFNENMAKVGTLIPGQTERLRELKDQISALSVESGIAVGDLSEGAYAAISAWGDSADLIDRLRVAAKAAQAGNASTEETLGMLTSLTEIFGESSAQAVERVSDLAFVTNKLAIRAPFGELASSMGPVAALAKAMNISMEDMFATMTAGAGVTGNVTEVATQMSSLYSALLQGTTQMDGALTRMNKQFGTSFKDPIEAISKLGTGTFITRLKGVSRSTAEFREILGGRKEGLILALALAGERGEKYNEALEEMRTNTGQTAVAHKEITDGINKEGHSWEKTKQKLDAFRRALGDRLLPILDKYIAKLEPLFNALVNVSDEQMDLNVQIGAFALALGPALKLLGVLIGFLAKVKAGLVAIATFAGAAAGTFAAVAAGILVAFAAVYRYFETLKNGVEMVFSAISLSFNLMLDAVLSGLQLLADNIAKIPVIGNLVKPIAASISGKREDLQDSRNFNLANIGDRARDLPNALERDYGRMPWRIGQLSPEAQASKELQQWLKADTQKNQWQNAYSGMMNPRYPGNGEIKMGDTTINVTSNGDAKETARLVKAEIQKRDRKQADAMRQLINRQAVAEQ